MSIMRDVLFVPEPPRAPSPSLLSTDTATRNHLREPAHNPRSGHATLRVVLQPSSTECEVAAIAR